MKKARPTKPGFFHCPPLSVEERPDGSFLLECHAAAPSEVEAPHQRSAETPGLSSPHREQPLRTRQGPDALKSRLPVSARLRFPRMWQKHNEKEPLGKGSFHYY